MPRLQPAPPRGTTAIGATSVAGRTGTATSHGGSTFLVLHTAAELLQDPGAALPGTHGMVTVLVPQQPQSEHLRAALWCTWDGYCHTRLDFYTDFE
eukprot:10944774-Lingulodinium_polyedra.AAC.1